jgi:hypothetical protein
MDASHQQKRDPRLRRVAKAPVQVIVELSNAEAAKSESYSWRFFMGFNAVLYPLLLIGLAVYPSITKADKLKIQGIAGGDNVLVLGDARKNSGASGCANDQVFRSTGETALPNFLSSAGCNSEIAIFAANNAMLLETPVNTWTNRPTDVHTATLQPIIMVPVSVWIADATPGARTKAEQDMAHANLLYRQNKVGVHFVPTFVPVSGAAVATINNSVALAGSDIECKDVPGVQASGFYTANTLNVYYVTLGITGRNCAIKQTPTSCPGTDFEYGDGNITYIGTAANRAALAHEFGHAFGLRPGPCGGHTNGLAGFGPNNIMWGGGDGNRDQFSLGQVFRMNTHSDQWGGTMLIQNGLRPGPGRKCPPTEISAICPALNKDWHRP